MANLKVGWGLCVPELKSGTSESKEVRFEKDTSSGHLEQTGVGSRRPQALVHLDPFSHEQTFTDCEPGPGLSGGGRDGG